MALSASNSKVINTDLDSQLNNSINSAREKSRFRFICPLFSVKSNKLNILSFLSIKTPEKHSLDDLRISFGEIEHKPTILFSKQRGASNNHLVLLKVGLSLPELRKMSIHNKVRAYFLEKDCKNRIRPITYDVLLRKYCAKHSPYLYDEQDDTVAFFRQNKGRSITLTVRHSNITDKSRNLWKLRLAWLLAKLIPYPSPVLIYEKNSSKYEESGKFVFEYLIDNKVSEKRCLFIAPKKICDDSSIPERYRDSMVAAHSFKHYFSFFKCKSFIGTEAMSHALELRCQSFLVQKKLASPKNKYAFLQHGVMYMVSLNSPQRTSFLKNNMPPNSYVVVSSSTEANHFINYGGFDQDDLIISGLPKFDGSKQNQGADKILIMPTWRIWEFNQIRSNPDESGYVKMINRIVNGVPEDLRDKIVVCPHPLFNQATFGTQTPSEKSKSIDDLLREARVFITDYSSAAYDAFYRGSAVVFFWEELQDCMAHYGGETHLMLNESNVFGRVAYNSDEIRDAVAQAYQNGQSKEDRQRYSKIVEFHDNQNTKRCVGKLLSLGFFN